MESFYYVVDGEPHHGSGDQYVKALEMESLGVVAVSHRVWTVRALDLGRLELVEWNVDIFSTGYNEDDWATVTVRIPGVGFEGSYSADGRA